MAPPDATCGGPRQDPETGSWPEIGSRLSQRIAALERLIEQAPSSAASAQLLEPMLERLKLLAGMVDRLGVDEARALLVGLLVREAEASCMSCVNAAECSRWLAAKDDDDAYRGFCPNAAMLDLLPRKTP